MRTGLLIACVFLATASSPASAGLDLTWNACNLSVDHTSQVSFDCLAEHAGIPYRAIGCFQVEAALDSFVAMDIVIDLCVNSAGLPDFWLFESCDSSGVKLIHVRPSADICPNTTDPWSSTTTSSLLYQPGPSAAHGRFVGSIGRPSSEPFDLHGSTNNFGFELDFFTDNAVESGGACSGCSVSGELMWSAASLVSVRSSGPASYQVTGPGLVSNRLCFNDGCFSCFGDLPVKNKTWGQLKSMYR